MTNYDWVVTAG